MDWVEHSPFVYIKEYAIVVIPPWVLMNSHWIELSRVIKWYPPPRKFKRTYLSSVALVFTPCGCLWVLLHFLVESRYHSSSLFEVLELAELFSCVERHCFLCSTFFSSPVIDRSCMSAGECSSLPEFSNYFGNMG